MGNVEEIQDQVSEEKESESPVENDDTASVNTADPIKTPDEPVLLSGKVIKIEDLEEESEYDEKEFEVLKNLYEKTILDFSEGEIVTGKILSISDKEIAVDIGFKSEGVIPTHEFKSIEGLNVGDDIDILLDKMEDREGQLRLSKEKADFARRWEVVVQKHESEEIVEGKCVRRIKGGMVVDLQGIDAFLPGSQIDVKPVRDFDALLGQIMEFKIVKVNHLRKNIVISRRVIIEEGLSEQREKMLKELEKGQVRLGLVKNITDFGVFIDLGGIDGLLHITDLSWGRVAHPSEIVSLDEKIDVVILDFDLEKKRVSLGLKQLLPHPWENVEEKYPVGSKVQGKVVSITDYGAFVELEKGIEGLIHISEMSWTQHIKHPSKILSIGEEVETVVLNSEKDEKKISLGLKQIEPDPWTTVVSKYPVGSKYSGTVRNITNFGVFVELEEGIDGLVHISDLSWTKKVRHPSEIVKKGDEIEVIILNVSIDDRRISLGHKQVVENPWESFEVELQKGVVTTGKVVRHVEKGIIVELIGGFEGFVPSSHMQSEEDGKKKSKKQYNVGDEIKLKIIEFDKENKKIVLSQSEFLKDSEDQDVQEYLEKQNEAKDDSETEVEKETIAESTDAAETKPEEEIVETSDTAGTETSEETAEVAVEGDSGSSEDGQEAESATDASQSSEEDSSTEAETAEVEAAAGKTEKSEESPEEKGVETLDTAGTETSEETAEVAVEDDSGLTEDGQEAESAPDDAQSSEEDSPPEAETAGVEAAAEQTEAESVTDSENSDEEKTEKSEKSAKSGKTKPKKKTTKTKKE